MCDAAAPLLGRGRACGTPTHASGVAGCCCFSKAASVRMTLARSPAVQLGEYAFKNEYLALGVETGENGKVQAARCCVLWTRTKQQAPRSHFAFYVFPLQHTHTLYTTLRGANAVAAMRTLPAARAMPSRPCQVLSARALAHASPRPRPAGAIAAAVASAWGFGQRWTLCVSTNF